MFTYTLTVLGDDGAFAEILTEQEFSGPTPQGTFKRLNAFIETLDMPETWYAELSDPDNTEMVYSRTHDTGWGESHEYGDSIY